MFSDDVVILSHRNFSTDLTVVQG